ncbi:MAG TPA: 1,4-dihydroxy-2-naphthoyl-CoA hydrolase [Cyanothece sp. UBA12306]|nr:1,4-dihydroxy-2-naphthoyl-CoA hydrolase [Cyanothece sp. UBA12306]
MNTYNRRIYLSDTDAAGVVYFASLLSICHEAYETSLQAAAIDFKTLVSPGNLALPIVHAEIDFFRPLFCGDDIIIKLSCVELKDTEFIIIYQVSVSLSPEICVAKAQTKHVCINLNTRQRNPLSDSLVKWLCTIESSKEN